MSSHTYSDDDMRRLRARTDRAILKLRTMGPYEKELSFQRFQRSIEKLIRKKRMTYARVVVWLRCSDAAHHGLPI
jgi:hypothetical protein